jgi:hypothetical protein
MERQVKWLLDGVVVYCCQPCWHSDQVQENTCIPLSSCNAVCLEDPFQPSSATCSNMLQEQGHQGPNGPHEEMVSMYCACHTSGLDAAACRVLTSHTCSHLKQQLQRLEVAGSSLCLRPGPAAVSVYQNEQAAAALARLCYCCLLACSALLLGCSRLLQNHAHCWQRRSQELLCMFAAGT